MAKKKQRLTECNKRGGKATKEFWKMIRPQVRQGRPNAMWSISTDNKHLISGKDNLKVSSQACPDGWRRNQWSCYLLVDTPKTWQDARDACRLLQADLASLTTADEQTYIGTQTVGARYWFGLSDIVAEGNWQWADGTDYDPSPAVTNWGPDEPNNLNGEDCAQILPSGRWNDAACKLLQGYVCERTDCPELPVPSNGSKTEDLYGDTFSVTFSCNEGHELIGSENRTCKTMTNQSWSGVQPICSRKLCQQLMSPSYGNISGGSSYGDVVTYYCDAGYEISGDEERTCQSDQTWSGTQPSCVRKPCPELPLPTNGNRTQGHLHGDTVTFSCNEGHELIGSENRTCQANQSWSGIQPTCSGKLCHQLMAPSNGNIYGGSSYGDVVTYHCDAGYEISGDEERTCRSDQTWSGTQPSCVRGTPGLSTLHVVTIAVVPSVALLVLGVVAGILIYRRGRKWQSDDLELEEFDFHPDILDLQKPPPPVPTRPQFLEYEVKPTDLRLNEEIGRGAFGIVFLATLKRAVNGILTERTVVVKTVHENPREEEIQNFIQEIDTTITLRQHINLLGLVGCCTLSHPPYLVTEYMPYGDLKSFLLKCRKLDERLQDSMYDFDEMKIYQVARQIANGMIHISQAGYVHGDLAARNVLVGEDLVVKIADFGLTTDIYERGYKRQDAEQKIPVRWMAPERLCERA
ncbi:uncharacterized protein LOC144909366, partial [Branchiostoma floridae x Branchiostoma belcheri]